MAELIKAKRRVKAMWSIGLRIVVGLLLIIHGIAHYSITTGWGSRQSADSWALGGLGLGTATITPIGNVLMALSLFTFLASGVLLFFNQEWWWALAVTASVFSLLVITLFWQPNMVLGLVLDVAIIVALLWPNSPVVETIGR
jgi:hypothetical protein